MVEEFFGQAHLYTIGNAEGVRDVEDHLLGALPAEFAAAQGALKSVGFLLGSKSFVNGGDRSTFLPCFNLGSVVAVLSTATAVDAVLPTGRGQAAVCAAAVPARGPHRVRLGRHERALPRQARVLATDTQAPGEGRENDTIFR
jgi:hypothetical protein